MDKITNSALEIGQILVSAWYNGCRKKEDSTSSKRFTEEQQQKLRQNQYVYNVTPTRLSVTKEFKERFIETCDAGESPRTFLENHGFSTELIGERRFFSIPQHIRAEFRKNGGFREGYGYRISGEHAPERPESTDDELKSLRHEVDYLKQEMEFLKKFPQSGIRKGRCAAYERILLRL